MQEDLFYKGDKAIQKTTQLFEQLKKSGFSAEQ